MDASGLPARSNQVSGPPRLTAGRYVRTEPSAEAPNSADELGVLWLTDAATGTASPASESVAASKRFRFAGDACEALALQRGPEDGRENRQHPPYGVARRSLVGREEKTAERPLTDGEVIGELAVAGGGP